MLVHGWGFRLGSSEERITNNQERIPKNEQRFLAVLGLKLARLLYCVTLVTPDPEPNLSGGAEQPVPNHDSHGLRIYWSEVTNPETLAAGPTRKAAEATYRHLLREMLVWATPIAFPFPALVAEPEEIDALLAEKGEEYIEALHRLAGTVQYELTATWEDDERADLATPVSGRAYLKRREEAEVRIAAIDTKLKTVAAGKVAALRV